MTIELLNKNIEQEEKIIHNLFEITNQIEDNSSEFAQKKILSLVNPLLGQLQIVNNAIPELIHNISFYKDLTKKEEVKKTIVNIKTNETAGNINVAVKKKEEKKFLDYLQQTKSLLFAKEKKEDSNSLSELTFILNISNRLFKNYSSKLIADGYFRSIKEDLKKITSPFLATSYISMLFFITSFLFLLGVFSGVVCLVLFKNIALALLVLFGLPIVGFLVFYLYPSSRKKSLEKEINQELPFVTIYMSAIATSGIEPSKIFDILVSSGDYPYIQREVKKLNNMIKFYGYDLVSALRAMSKMSPSDRLSQLFDGISTTITSGGELTTFLDKHSESLLFDYRLEREKYTHVAETFMNIYISVVIAAPMIMLMLFILMSLTSLGVGFLGPAAIGVLTVLVIVLLNIGFIVFLNMKQPKF
jgi:Flp pilus assembly protein TadB